MRKGVLQAAAWIVLVVTLAMVARLAGSYFASGAIYPAFSSLRSDPPGSKALYDALEALQRRPKRSYVPLEGLKIQDSTLLLLGVRVESLLEPHTALAAAGNTVVIGLSGPCVTAAVKIWNLKLACDGKLQYLEGPQWGVLERGANGRPDIIERKFGLGEIILLADARWMNNGSLAQTRRTDAIAGLLERRRTVLFDEHHLGVTDNASVGLLIRRYRLYGVVAAALLLFTLFVWRNSSSFLPRIERRTMEIAGKDSGAGLANLLRGSIPASELMALCIAEWAKSDRAQTDNTALKNISATHKNPVDAYNAVARLISEKNRQII